VRGRFQRLLRDFGSDGTTWRAAIFEQGSAKAIYELSARISTLFNAKGTPIEDFLKPDALSEECERDFRRLQETTCGSPHRRLSGGPLKSRNPNFLAAVRASSGGERLGDEH
jgi:hypothetical protein